MQTTELFAHLVRDLCSALLDAHELDLEQRIDTVWRTLGIVSATGASLEVFGGEPPPFAASPLTDWPGFGSLDAYWKETDDGPVPMVLSETLTFVFQQLWVGLESFEAGNEERATAIWGAGFESTWGPASLEILNHLHPAVVAYRRDRRPTKRASNMGSPLVMVGTKAQRTMIRPTLGLQIQPGFGGVEVLAVHPNGPAAGLLQAGDVVLSVDGTSLAGLPEQEAGASLTGPIGDVRAYEVYRAGETLALHLASVGIHELG